MSCRIQMSPLKQSIISIIVMIGLLIAFTMLAAFPRGAGAAESPRSFNFCTGTEGGFYESLGVVIGNRVVEKSGGVLEIINTGGSVENARLLKDGECDIGLLQADAVTTLPLPRDIKVTDAHNEVIFWIHPKKGPVDDFGEMENSANKKRYGVAIVAGSGAEVTLNSFAKTDDDYRDVRQIEFEDWYSAAEATAQGFAMIAGVRVEIAGMLYVGRSGFITSDITEDFGNEVMVGEINDNSFLNAKDVNGNPLYKACTVNSKETSGLELSTTLAADTYCVRAQVVYNNDYHKTLNNKESRLVRRAVDKGINATVKAVR